MNELTLWFEQVFEYFVTNDALLQTMIVVASMFVLYGLLNFIIWAGSGFKKTPTKKLWYVFFAFIILAIVLMNPDIIKIFHVGDNVENHVINYDRNGYFIQSDEDLILDKFTYIEYKYIPEYQNFGYEINVGLLGENYYNKTVPFLLFEQPYPIMTYLTPAPNTSLHFGMALYKETTTGAFISKNNSAQTNMWTNTALNNNNIYIFIIGKTNYA